MECAVNKSKKLRVWGVEWPLRGGKRQVVRDRKWGCLGSKRWRVVQFAGVRLLFLSTVFLKGTAGA